MKKIQDFDGISVKLASPERIREWSYGEVKKPETINYRTLRPEKDGLFCERIFGTTKEWECYCGKFKSIRYKGVVCDRCGVEVTHFRVRRERMGHIELATPVSHIWYYRSVPSRIGLLLDLTVSALRSVLYYEKYIVIDPGGTDLNKMDLLNEEEYEAARERYGMTFTASIGAESLLTLLEQIDLDQLAVELRDKMNAKRMVNDQRLLKRIELVENFRSSGNRPEWMIFKVIPVLPPELRPMVQLDGGRFATSDLNDLYRRVINRNNRLKRLMALKAPDIIVRNEKRMLQEAVDALFDNSKKRRAVKGSANRALRSLSDLIRGKQGRFRQNLLGKRVDYSGRSVIVPGPDLKLHQCGLPIKMALELFKPFIMKKLVERDVVYNVKRAKSLVDSESPEVWEILDEVIQNHLVLLNRAPTLHRLGIQAFEPMLVGGKALRLHPLVCHAYNADFDGDQMAVHVPLTQAAQVESWTLMLSTRNLLNPADGRPIVFPSRDIVLGIYHLTAIKQGGSGQGRRFFSTREAIMAREFHHLDYQTPIELYHEGEIIETTVGRILLNEELPPGIPFVNQTLGESELHDFIATIYQQHGQSTTVEVLETIKRLGFHYSTIFGATIGVADITIPKDKSKMITAANKLAHTVQEQYRKGHITNEERYNRVVDIWNKTNEELTDVMMEHLQADSGGFNPVYLMAISGARGSRNQIRQLAGMRGLMAKPSGDIIELPIRSNFKEGLSVIEFFISTNGARKGLADTALKTSDAGYLTRRLVDIAQDAVVNEDDCGTINGIEISALKEGEEIVESLSDRIRGRYTIERVRHPITSEIMVEVNQEITNELAESIEYAGIEAVRIRTELTCESKHGICRLCYGRNLATNRTVEIGEAVGIIAAQSIGQPGTQLTMRTFHIGGTATKAAEESRTYLKYPVLIQGFEGNRVTGVNGHQIFTRKGTIVVARILKQLKREKGDSLLIKDKQKVFRNQPIIKRDNKKIEASENAFILTQKDSLLLITQSQRLEMRNGAEVYVNEGDIVPENEPLATFDPFSEPIIAEQAGTVVYADIILGTTLREEVNQETGNVQKVISEELPEGLQPRIVIEDSSGKELGYYYLPEFCYLMVEDGTKVRTGKILAKLPRESAKTRDITGGLPRVSELFEARRPKNAAVLAKVDGTIEFEGIHKGARVINIVDDFGTAHRHLVPLGRHLFVRDRDIVKVGERLCEGAIDPHIVLSVQGEGALQRFLVNRIQEVYRLQGVGINDKHIGVIIRQMMRKVEIRRVGDTKFIFAQQVDKYSFREENLRVVRSGGEPAVARPLLLGITRASLNIESFISAASFQETTRVLTDAAVAGKMDNLHGLKENVIIGHQIPAGTGMPRYRAIRLFDSNHEDLDQRLQVVLEERARQKELEEEMANNLASDVLRVEEESEVIE